MPHNIIITAKSDFLSTKINRRLFNDYVLDYALSELLFILRALRVSSTAEVFHSDLIRDLFTSIKTPSQQLSSAVTKWERYRE